MFNRDPKPVKLGNKYRDTITGFTGTAVSRSEYLYGCVRVGLEHGDEKGDVKEAWFDEQRLVEASTSVPVATTARTGGPQSMPPARR